MHTCVGLVNIHDSNTHDKGRVDVSPLGVGNGLVYCVKPYWLDGACAGGAAPSGAGVCRARPSRYEVLHGLPLCERMPAHQSTDQMYKELQKKFATYL